MFAPDDLDTMQLCAAPSIPPASATPARCSRHHGCAERCPAPTAGTRSSRPAWRSDSRWRKRSEPADAAGVAAKLKWANGEGLAVSIRGAGTKQSWSARAGRTDVVLSTLGLNAPADHVAGDLVATVPAGSSLDAVNDVLRRERQWLPLDPACSNRATIGGIISTNDSGPRRHRFGTPRDLIIGIEIALADGRIARAGGRVVKNVAGYDLSKLLCGSLGSLAVVTSATFKLAPLPPASSTLVASLPDARSAGALAAGPRRFDAHAVHGRAPVAAPPAARSLRNIAARHRAADCRRGRPVRDARCGHRGSDGTGGSRRLARARAADGGRCRHGRETGDAATDVAGMLVARRALTAEHGIGTRQPGGPPSA